MKNFKYFKEHRKKYSFFILLLTILTYNMPVCGIRQFDINAICPKQLSSDDLYKLRSLPRNSIEQTHFKIPDTDYRMKIYITWDMRGRKLEQEENGHRYLTSRIGDPDVISQPWPALFRVWDSYYISFENTTTHHLECAYSPSSDPNENRHFIYLFAHLHECNGVIK